jgi:hypothetical protein
MEKERYLVVHYDRITPPADDAKDPAVPCDNPIDVAEVEADSPAAAYAIVAAYPDTAWVQQVIGFTGPVAPTVYHQVHTPRFEPIRPTEGNDLGDGEPTAS